MKYTIKRITIPSLEETNRKARMIALNRKLRGDHRVLLGGDTSSVSHDNSQSTEAV